MSGFSSTSRNVLITQYATPTTGSTVNANAGVEALMLNPAGTLATLTVALPVSPVDGQSFSISTTQIITALTITGTIVGTLTTLSLGGYAWFLYSATAAKWMRAG